MTDWPSRDLAGGGCQLWGRLCPRVRGQRRGRAVRCPVHGLPPRSPGPATALVSCQTEVQQRSN